MALPKKKSRSITVDDTRYRWMVSIHQHVMYLTIEAEDDPGQTSQALFEPHDQFKREADGNWSFHRQGRSLTPRDVTKIIRYGLANNWKPQSKGQKPILLYAWDAERVAPGAQNLDTNEVPLRDIAIEQVSDLRFDLSLDPVLAQDSLRSRTIQAVHSPRRLLRYQQSCSRLWFAFCSFQ